jgi:penicillin-binding protein 1A
MLILKKILKFLFRPRVVWAAVLAIGLLFGLLCLKFWDDGVFSSEKDQIEKITAAIIPDSSIVYDRNKEKIGEFYNYYHVAIPYNDLPQELIHALLSIEDRKFFEHNGINWKSMGRAVLASFVQGRLAQGGSTLTMQLVKNYLLTREKKVSRKVRELILSYYVEKNLSKERILELYLNTMYMGHGAYGVGAASQTYFGKPLQALNTPELALLAGLFQAPSAYDPHKNLPAAIKRRNLVLQAMVKSKFITNEQAKDYTATMPEIKPWTALNETIAPFFLSWVRQQVVEKLGDQGETINDVGYRIYTTLDKSIQLLANKAVQSSADRLSAYEKTMHLKRGDRLETALLAIDPQSGAILAMVGGRSYKQSPFNRAVAARRSPGSSFKPVTYSLALEKGMGWNDMVFVSPINVGGYRPKNHEGDDLTEVTLIKAFARSMNTPVISLAQKFGVGTIIERAQAMGVTAAMPREIGIAIGGFSASVADVGRIYSTIANQGTLMPTSSLLKIENSKQEVLFDAAAQPSQGTVVFNDRIAGELRSGLQAVLTIGTGSHAADLANIAAGKTGTSDDSRDNWFCGFTKNFVAVTWVGTDLNASLGKAASGASLALPIWSEFMRDVTAGPRPAETWTIPEGYTSMTIDPEFGTPAATGVTALFKNDRLPKASQASDDIKALKENKGETYRPVKIDD